MKVMMKKYFIFSLFAMLLVSACTEKELDPVLRVGNAPVLTSPASGTDFVLEEANAGDKLTSFTWSIADFGFQAGVSYTLEMDKANNDFANPVTLGTVVVPIIDNMTVGKMNGIMLAQGFPDGVPTSVELRIKAVVHAETAPVYSDVVTVSITPFKQIIIYPKLHVPGSYQAWAPENETTVVYSVRSDNKYEGFLYFPDPNTAYKFTDGPSWATNWGDTGADGTLDLAGDDITVVDAGMYRLSADLNSLTHAAVKTEWGLIGDATPTGWDSDTNLIYDDATGTLKLTVDLVVGKIKFRANDDWDINFGDNDGNGSLEYGGTDIDIAEAGNYTIELILNVADYTYRVTKN